MTSKIVSIPSTLKSGTVVTETSYGQSSTAGLATTVSKGDHTHGTPATDAVTQQTFPSRTLSTVYQNTTGKPLFVSINFDTQFNAPGQILSIGAVSDAGNPPTQAVSETSFAQSITARDIMEWAIFIVLPGNFYEVTASISAGGTTSIRRWIEWV